jgi:Uma2 family endonuclease
MNGDRDTALLPTGQRRITAEEYFQMPEGPPYFQLIDGELIMSPSPRYFHQVIVARLIGAIIAYLDSNPIGQVVGAPSDVQLDEQNVFQPDLYFIRNERFRIIDEQGPKGAPDLVAEVISPGTKRNDLGRKKTISAERGVIDYWTVFPDTREVHVYLLQESREQPARKLKGNDAIETPLLPGLRIPLSKIFKA